MKHLVILTGAGMSEESGIETFRDSGGLWEGHDIKEVASINGFHKNPKLVLDFYNQRRQKLREVEPNLGHIGLAELQQHFRMSIITQNVDDLHERAGSRRVLHLHGQLTKKRSVVTDKHLYDWGDEDLKPGDKAPDGRQVRPHIVWFGESVPMIYTANELAAQADIFVVIGTSLQVYPAAGLLNFAGKADTKFLLDKKVPDISLSDFKIIKKSAVNGIEELKLELLKLK